MNKYKAIGFDHGGVIGGLDRNGEGFLNSVCELLNISQEEFKTAYFKINHLINEGKVASRREFWGIFLKDIAQPDKLDGLCKLSEERTKEIFVTSQPMLDLVDELRRKGYKVGLLSNNSKENGDRLREMGLDEHFDVFVISADIGVQKPKPIAFNHFFAELDVDPGEVVFVDDSEKSLSTAEECGFTPILFTTYEDLKQKLCDLEILTD